MNKYIVCAVEYDTATKTNALTKFTSHYMAESRIKPDE